jgi:hypothetical protein
MGRRLSGAALHALIVTGLYQVYVIFPLMLFGNLLGRAKGIDSLGYTFAGDHVSTVLVLVMLATFALQTLLNLAAGSRPGYVRIWGPTLGPLLDNRLSAREKLAHVVTNRRGCTKVALCLWWLVCIGTFAYLGH